MYPRPCGSLLSCTLQSRFQKPGLGQRLASRKGDAAAGFVEEGDIAANFLDEFTDLDWRANQLARFRGTSFGAGAAKRATGRVALRAIVPTKCAGFADITARLATDAAAGNEHRFGLIGLAFGVMAPRTTQWATLQENSGSDAGTIMKGEPHDVEDEARGRLGRIDRDRVQEKQKTTHRSEGYGRRKSVYSIHN